MSEQQDFKAKEFNLSILEQRVTQLLELVKKLKQENSELRHANQRLHEQVESLKNSIMAEDKDLKALNEEKAKAHATVDDLIKSIDSLVEVAEGNNE